MNRSLITTSILVALFLLALAMPAFAGGWATITVDQWPAQITANQSVLIGFTVRQHGHDDRRLGGLNPTLTAKNDLTGKTLSVAAKDEGAVGHYVASLTFPEPGAWSWSIQAFTMDQPMPKLTVNGAVLKPPTPTQPSITPAILAGFLGLAFVVMAVVLAWRKRTRWALVLVLVGLLAWGVGVASAAGKPAASKPAAGPASFAGEPAAAQPLSQVEYGKTLFIAKGCVTCHVNPRIDSDFVVFRLDVGKDLTNYVAAPEFLRLWLKDPKAVKPKTEMPNLGLSDAEIEALIAFVNSPAETK